MPVRPLDIIARQLTDDGTPTGNENMSVDGSVTPQLFWVEPPGGRNLIISRLLVLLEDTGNFTPNTFGNATALTNGVDIRFKDFEGNVSKNILPGGTIRRNVDFNLLGFDNRLDAYGSGNNFIASRFSLNNFARDGIELRENERLEFIVQDDLSGIVRFVAVAQGYIAPRN